MLFYKNFNMRIGLMLLLVCLFEFVSSQNNNLTNYQKDRQLIIKITNSPIKIDGILDEKDWQTAPQADSFWRKFPDDLGKSNSKTIAKVLYDKEYLYFSFIVYDSQKSFIQSLKRDGGHDGNDCVGIILDPLNKHNNGFFFVVNAHNAQSEDQLGGDGGGGNGFNWSWDTKWFSAVKNYGNYWIAEVAIPFKSLRYDQQQLIWGLNFLRVNTKKNEYSTWTHVPVNFRSHDVGYTGAMFWQNPPPKSKKNISFIPYITAGLSQEKEFNDKKDITNINNTSIKDIGFDAKVSLSSSLNLDITANPNFSQIEVDQQVTNLTRFSINYPEKRTFFLENSDLFSNFGIPPIRPFNSRTIGLDKDGHQIPIILGARVSGSLSPKTRIGMMNIQGAKDSNNISQNFTAITIQQQVLKRSVLKGYFLNKESFDYTDNFKKQDPINQYGRNAGIQFDFSNIKGSVNAWASFHTSIKPFNNTENNFIEAGVEINGRHLGYVIDIANLGTNYYTDMGFVQRINNYDALKDTTVRLGFKHVFQAISYRFLPTKGRFNMINIGLESYTVFNPNNTFNESSNNLNIEAQMRNTAFVFLGISRTDNDLLFATRLTDSKYDALPLGKYGYTQLNVGYGSDYRKNFSWRAFGGIGEFYNGIINSVGFRINYRNQPHINISINADYNFIKFPNNYGQATLLLISPKIDINFNTKLFWTTYLQFNTQGNDFNINSRLQYRFKPLSDLFIVYTDNYFTDPLFKNKSRAIVFKINYWLNL